MRLLRDRRLLTRAGGIPSPQLIDHIFSDRFYAGIVRDPWSGEEHAGRHMPMVSRETFNEVQRIIAKRNRAIPHRAVRVDFPLRTFVRCGNCEFALTGSFSRGRSRMYPYYHCHRHDCDNRAYYPLGDVHEEFVQFLAEVSADDHSIAHLKEHVRKIADSWSANHRTMEEKREIEIKRAHEQMQQLIHMKAGNLITDDEFQNHRALLSHLLAEVTSSGLELRTSSEDVLAELDTICTPLMHLAETWQSISVELRQRFQQILLPNGYVYGRVGTAQKAHILSFLESPLPVDTNAVRPIGESWNQLAGEILQIAMIFKESAGD